MAYKIDIKSLVIGLLVGLVVLLVLGATSRENKGTYQLSMTTDSVSGFVIYGRIHTGTGRIETWKYLSGTSNVVPHLGDNKTILIGPDGKRLPD